MSRKQTVTCIINCKSVEDLRICEQKVRGRIDCDRIVTRTWRRFPRGVEKKTVKKYKLGDYFDSIELIPSKIENSFNLIFYPRQGADPYWKDLIIAVMQSVSDSHSVTWRVVVPHEYSV